MYQGFYHGKKHHDGDLQDVLDRAWSNGMQKMYITGGSLKDSKRALELAKSHENLYCTVGCHPTRCKEFTKDPDNYFKSLLDLIKENREKVVAVGECGLDYDRLFFCPKDIQLQYFERQFDLAEQSGLPMFLHCRAAADDFLTILRRNKHKMKSGGVVHSFTGTKEEAASYIAEDLYISINGCSLKLQENIDAMLTIPTNRLLIETDGPWCEIKATHASSQYVKTKFKSVKKEKWQKGLHIKGRNEPCNIIQVLEVLAETRKEDIISLADIIYNNTLKLFGGQ
ncbi:DgyrCDS4241 [Dimorphilus gyrociliatus]|uniref:Deoxyribonuclease TATDN1 n=1 Tax=Dimorphilus gyrociliatus TaxID=2664684 RepID=A0A7I8VKZ2_9ANNE|nr:DgyrCDS4241 [Dimorphilus gyrociliatus]